MFFDMAGRIVVEGVKLAVVIRGWLRATPDRLWGSDPNYEALKKLKRHDPELAPDPRREVANYIVHRLQEVDWEVTQPEPEEQVSPPPYRG